MILVTGGTGFLGRNMLPILLQKGYPVRVVTRQPELYPWLADDKRVQIVQADVADASAMHHAAKGARYIIHAAGLFRFFGKPEDFEATNIQGTHNLMQAAQSSGVEKIVHVSTIAVAGYPRDPRQVIDETTPTNPNDDYQRTKLQGEEIVLEYARQGVPAVIVRGGAFYGPYGRYAFNRLFFEDPLMNYWPMGIDRGRHITFPVYIKDMAQGVLLGLEKGCAGEIYNIASQSMSHREVEKTIARLSDTSAWRFHAPGGMMRPIARVFTWLSGLLGRELHYVVNMEPYIFGEWNVSIEKAKKELGFDPTPFEAGVKETLQWYADTGLWKPKKGPYA